MTISIELNEISNPELKNRTEDAIRDCIENRPSDEDWKIWIHALGRSYRVVVKGPIQTRERLFFEEIRTLPERIRNWLELYPLS